MQFNSGYYSHHPVVDYFNAMEVIMQQTACNRNSRQSKGGSDKAELPTAAPALLR